MIKQVSRWVNHWITDRCIILIGDGGFSCIRLAHECIKVGVTLISRLRPDSRLYEFPGEQPPDKRGRKPQKGERITKLKYLASDPTQDWKETYVRWYGQSVKSIHYLTGVNLWHTSGEEPVPVRWVLSSCPLGTSS